MNLETPAMLHRWCCSEGLGDTQRTLELCVCVCGGGSSTLCSLGYMITGNLSVIYNFNCMGAVSPGSDPEKRVLV